MPEKREEKRALHEEKNRFHVTECWVLVKIFQMEKVGGFHGFRRIVPVYRIDKTNAAGTLSIRGEKGRENDPRHPIRNRMSDEITGSRSCFL